MNIDAFIDEYLVSRSQETEKAYRSDLRKFAAFLVEQGIEVDALRPTHIRAFVNWLAVRRNTLTKRRGLSEDTIKRHVSAVRAYYKWLRFSIPQFLDPTSFFHFRRGKMRRKVLGIPAEVVDRMCAADEKKEAAIVLLFRRSGVRLSELIALNRNSFETFPSTAEAPAHARLTVRGKGGKTRAVLVSQARSIPYATTLPKGETTIPPFSSPPAGVSAGERCSGSSSVWARVADATMHTFTG